MKRSKFLAGLLALVLCFTLAACGGSKDATGPLLYKVSDESGNVVWLFGSIHVGEEDFYPLPDYVTDAFEGSDSLAVEFDIVAFEKDMNAQVAALQQLVYMDGTTIEDHISPELYEEAKAILEDAGLYSFALDYYLPVLWFSFIDSAFYEKVEADSTLGVDMHMINLAYEQGKDVLDVESAEFQYGMLAGFSPELQELLLESSVESYYDDDGEAQLKLMMETWQKGDEEAFDALINTPPVFEDEHEEALYAEYNDAMVTQRNVSMADFAEDALLSGEEVFICVGAAHIVGSGAMAELLAQRGYTVEIVR